MATFDGPARAVRCARAIVDAAASTAVQVRAGLHIGEVETLGNKVAGVAVHIGARVMARAGGGEILVSSTVKNIVAGSGIDFTDRGVHSLKGVPGDWELLAATGSTTLPSVPAEPPKPRLSDRLIVTAARRMPRVLTAANRMDAARARRA